MGFLKSRWAVEVSSAVEDESGTCSELYHGAYLIGNSGAHERQAELPRDTT